MDGFQTDAVSYVATRRSMKKAALFGRQTMLLAGIVLHSPTLYGTEDL